MTEELYQSCRRAVHVIAGDGQILRAGRAALFILERCGYPWSARLLRVRPLVWAVELGYWIVARNRAFFSRFMFRDDGPAGSA